MLKKSLDEERHWRCHPHMPCVYFMLIPLHEPCTITFDLTITHR